MEKRELENNFSLIQINFGFLFLALFFHLTLGDNEYLHYKIKQ